jgi:hypothetical protein
MNNKNFKKLLDDRIKPLPNNIFIKNLTDDYTIINDTKNIITSQKDLLIKLDNPNNFNNKYRAITDDRKLEEDNREIEYKKYMDILMEQKRKTQELVNRFNVK